MSSPVDFNTSFPAWMKVGWRGIFVKIWREEASSDLVEMFYILFSKLHNTVIDSNAD
jgi:hypothetical protein